VRSVLGYERRFLKLGLSDGVQVEVLEGLRAGEQMKVPVGVSSPAPRGGGAPPRR
jgi:Fe2+ transport system protein FeoA